MAFRGGFWGGIFVTSKAEAHIRHSANSASDKMFAKVFACISTLCVYSGNDKRFDSNIPTEAHAKHLIIGGYRTFVYGAGSTHSLNAEILEIVNGGF